MRYIETISLNFYNTPTLTQSSFRMLKDFLTLKHTIKPPLHNKLHSSPRCTDTDAIISISLFNGLLSRCYQVQW